MSHKNNYISDFRTKEVIDISKGDRLGFIRDIDVDLEKGVVNSIIIPGKRRFMGLFPPYEDIVIPWNKIKKIGEEVILVASGDNDV